MKLLNGKSLPYVANARVSGARQRARSTRKLCDVLHLVGEVSPRCRRRQWPALAAVQLDGVFDNSTQFIKYDLLVVTVTASVDQARRTANIAMVVVGPLDDLYVSRAVFHLFDSSIAS
jgi:hypothetical protein